MPIEFDDLVANFTPDEARANGWSVSPSGNGSPFYTKTFSFTIDQVDYSVKVAQKGFGKLADATRATHIRTRIGNNKRKDGFNYGIPVGADLACVIRAFDV